MNYIENQKWRYATKKFDASKKISLENIEILKEAMQLATSAYGLQLYKVIIIENPTLREELKQASWGQQQITEASHIVVFCNYTDVKNQHIDDYLNRTAKTQAIAIEKLNDYGNFMKSELGKMTKSAAFNWTHRQTYLALGNLLNACAELKIDACPMEGFEIEKYNEILDLPKQGLNAAVIATIGYRSKDDHTQNRPKVRKPFNELFEVI